MSKFEKQYGRRNYLLYLIEGGAFIGAVGFINPHTLLPSLILDQNGPEWLAALAPSLMVMGMFTVPILSYRIVEKLNRYKPFAVLLGFGQRFVYLIAAITLLYQKDNPLVTVVVIAMTPLLSGAIGGLALTAWQQCYMGAIPPKRRASNFAIRFLIGGLMGVLAGKVIEWTLEKNPGHVGYGHLHLYAAVFLFISLFAFVFIKERPDYDVASSTEKLPSKTTSNKGKLADLFATKERRRFWPALFLMHCMYLLVPFYAVGIRLKFEESASFLGVLAFWQMLGSSLGNLSAGIIGDKFGGRLTFMIGALFFALFVLPAGFVTNPVQAKILYMGYGFFMMVCIIGKDTRIMELAPADNRSFYLSIAALVSMLGMLSSSMVSYVLWRQYHNTTLLAVPTTVLFLVIFVLLLTGKRDSTQPKSPLKVVNRGLMRYFR